MNIVLLFSVLLVLSAIIINGWFSITKGMWITKPDGGKVWEGQVFGFWQKFLQQHVERKEYYYKDELLLKFVLVKELISGYGFIKITSSAIFVTEMTIADKALFRGVCLSHGFDAEFKDESGVLINLYRTVPVYKIPMFFQKPLGMCITCLSSTAGSVLFWFWYFLAGRIYSIYHIQELFIFLNLPLSQIICLWVLFCISLAYLNDVFFGIKKSLLK